MNHPTFMAQIDDQLERAHLYPILLYENGNCYLRYLIVFASGRIDLNGTIYSIEEIGILVQRGIVQTSVDDEEFIHIEGLLSLKVEKVFPIMEGPEMLGELADIVRELNGQPTMSDLCREAYARFLGDPSDENREQLKIAFERVPKHLDIFLLPFPEKPERIRKEIYGPRSG